MKQLTRQEQVAEPQGNSECGTQVLPFSNDTGSHSPGQSETHYLAQTSLQLSILLPQLQDAMCKNTALYSVGNSTHGSRASGTSGPPLPESGVCLPYPAAWVHTPMASSSHDSSGTWTPPFDSDLQSTNYSQTLSAWPKSCRVKTCFSLKSPGLPD